MVGENGEPLTPDWALPPRPQPADPSVPDNIHLGEN